MTDSVLFLATMNFAATHIDCMQRHSGNPQILADKVETIRLLNAKLESPSEALSDVSIGTVVMLVAMEVQSICHYS